MPIGPRRSTTHATSAVGLVTGVAAALAWRYAVPRELVDANKPAYRPGDKPGYMFVFDYLQHRSGPTWLPVILVLPAVGLAIGLLAGLLVPRRAVRRAPHLVGILAAVLTGASVGLVGAVVSKMQRPQMTFSAVTDPTFSNLSEDLPALHLVGQPRYIDFGLILLTFPLTGALTGLVIGFAFNTFRHVRARRGSWRKLSS